MRFIINPIVCILSLIILSFKMGNGNCEVFLSLDVKDQVTIYSTTNKDKIVKKAGHKFTTEDYLLFRILSSNDSMFNVEASYAITGEKVTGWIDRTTKLAIFPKLNEQKVFIYSLSTKRSPGTALPNYSGELRVLECERLWIKVSTMLNGEEITGWLPPDSQCSNPYTTCN